MAQDGAKIGASVGRELCGMFALDDESIDVVDLRRRILRGGSGGEKRLLDGEQGSAYKHSIPSLFDDPVSYDQFKRAKRNLTNQEYDTSVISNPPSLLHHFQPAFLPSNERKYVELNGPVPLMDVSLGSCYSLTVRSAPLKSLSYTHRDTSDRRYSSSHDRHNYKQIDHYESSSNYQSPSNHRYV
ncbi:unnamed protein product [Anisakis simplex]|uniref:Uncharacterized protein n=1 Tax=Anisakis simplex TaxID=6269 RepID=A0A0M3IZS5_ANISI|nr:unnamed protein product [Anisakis simplex]